MAEAMLRPLIPGNGVRQALRRRRMENRQARGTLHAILTDVHFWVPVVVLTVGLVLLGVLGS